jgi:hypothetical protein
LPARDSSSTLSSRSWRRISLILMSFWWWFARETQFILAVIRCCRPKRVDQCYQFNSQFEANPRDHLNHCIPPCHKHCSSCSIRLIHSRSGHLTYLSVKGHDLLGLCRPGTWNGGGSVY